MMKRIIACVKLVPTAAEVELDGQFRLKRDGANLQLNIADLSAVEAALQLKALAPDREVAVLSMGPAKAEPTLQELFALGVDRVILLSDRMLAGADSLATARTLAAAVRSLGGADCIFCGRRAMDAETGQIPGQLAAALELPALTNIQKVTAAEETLLCQRRLETGIAQVRISMPCLISVCEYSCTLRLPSIMGRRRAKGKQVEILTGADIGLNGEETGLSGSGTRVIHVDTKAPGLRNCRFCTPGELSGVIREVLP